MAGLLAVVPHSHIDGHNQQSHDCAVCRAHSVQVVIEPLKDLESPLSLLPELKVPDVRILFSQDASLPFESRAPPFLA